MSIGKVGKGACQAERARTNGPRGLGDVGC